MVPCGLDLPATTRKLNKSIFLYITQGQIFYYCSIKPTKTFVNHVHCQQMLPALSTLSTINFWWMLYPLCNKHIHLTDHTCLYKVLTADGPISQNYSVTLKSYPSLGYRKDTPKTAPWNNSKSPRTKRGCNIRSMVLGFFKPSDSEKLMEITTTFLSILPS